MRKALRYFAITGAVVLALIIAGFTALCLTLNASLPDYSGDMTLAGLSEPVTVERDSLGVVTIRAGNRLDEARAQGFVHGQERFFQMDLLRRSATGELSALVGAAALAEDRRRRIHQLRLTAERALQATTPEHRRLLEAYAEGVNAGLNALGARPFEYLLLRRQPEPWSTLDSLLVIGAMYFELQSPEAAFKRSEFVARENLPVSVADFLYPQLTAWDAPIVGPAGQQAVIPPADDLDLAALGAPALAALRSHASTSPEPMSAVIPGSNNWVVSGRLTSNGKPVLANDPHLGMGTPSIWFRVSLETGSERVTGASLPGVPGIVIGSNGHVAWGMTNSYGDWTDFVVLEPDPEDPSHYLTPEGSLPIELITSPIEVAHADDEPFSFERTVFGPVIGHLPDGRRYAVGWVAHATEGLTFDALDLVNANNIDEAFAIAHRSGMPAQNLVVADRDGRIGWTIIGPMPERRRRELISYSTQGAAFGGWLAAGDYPAVIDPANGLIWTANSRVVDGPMLAAIGDGGYPLGARAGQIRDRLRALGGTAVIDDMLAVQLDDEALFLDRWRNELLTLLDGENDELLAAARDQIRKSGRRAATDSVGYRLVRGWRLTMITTMRAALTAELLAEVPSWSYVGLRDEHWAWPMVSQEPEHLLHPDYASWHTFKLTLFEAYVRGALGVGSEAELGQRTWGEFNTIPVRHPLSRAVPVLGRWLDMPLMALPGDNNMPRVQTPAFGASARMAVSPGDEAGGYFHMPGGQSGHPLSRYYGAGHDDWAEGRASPFLPGPAEQLLVLTPSTGP